MKNTLLTICFGIFLIGFCSSSLGCFQQGQNVNIITNLNTSSVTLDILTSPSPNSQILLTNQSMTKNGNAFIYSFNDTYNLGVYTYGYSDAEGNVYSNDFEITTNGKCGTGSNIAFIIFLITAIYALNLFGFFGKNTTMTLLGGMFLIFLGVYLINNGIIIYRDDLTNYFSYITIVWGFVSALMAGYSMYEDM